MAKADEFKNMRCKWINCFRIFKLVIMFAWKW
jgi:hypothetical protein